MTPATRFIRDELSPSRRIERGRRAAVLAELARQAVPVLVTGRTTASGRPTYDALVSLDPARPGMWRMTLFDGTDLHGHVEAATPLDALRLAHRPGARMVQVTPETVDAAR